MAMYDAYMAQMNRQDFTLFNLDDIDATFDAIVTVKYSQIQQKMMGIDIQFTPYYAGHTLGGAIWKIVKGPEKIIYAVDCNSRAELYVWFANQLTLDTWTRVYWSLLERNTPHCL